MAQPVGCRAPTRTVGFKMIVDPAPGEFSLFFDVDGTLIDIAPHPDDVVVSPALVLDLRSALSRFGGAVALISGRTVGNLDLLFAPLRMPASGVHGAEFRFEPDGMIETLGLGLPTAVWEQLMVLLAGLPGVLVENKTYSFAVHYRATPHLRGDLEATLAGFIASHADLGLKLMPGHYVFELKPPAINKGAAISRFLEVPEFRGRRPIFLGDDVTDQAGFDMVLAHGGFAYSVGAPASGVSGHFANPATVREWLSSILVSEKHSA